MECVCIFLLLNMCLDLNVLHSVIPGTGKRSPKLWILTQLHDYLLRPEFLKVEML